MSAPQATVIIDGTPVSHRHDSGMFDLGWESYLGKGETVVEVTILGRSPVRVQRVLQEAAQAMDATLVSAGYENPCDFIGSFNVRPIAGLDVWSEHAYGTAIDLDFGGDNPASPAVALIDKNPDLGSGNGLIPGDERFGTACQITEAQVRAVEAIRTKNGRQVWGWLGWFPRGDTMHFGPQCRPEDLETGIDWSTVAQGGDLMEFAIAILQSQPDEFWPALKAKTGVPGGDEMYWSQSGTTQGTKATAEEWKDEVEVIFAAALRAAVLGEP